MADGSASGRRGSLSDIQRRDRLGGLVRELLRSGGLSGGHPGGAAGIIAEQADPRSTDAPSDFEPEA